MFVYYIIHPRIEGGMFISKSFEDWDDAYEEYCEYMESLDVDLSEAVARGIKEQG